MKLMKIVRTLLAASTSAILFAIAFVSLPAAASVSTILFSNLEHSDGGRGDLFMRDNYSATLKMDTPSDFVFTEVKFKLIDPPGNSNVTSRRVIFYTSDSGAPGATLGYLESSGYDSGTKIDTFSTGEGVEVPAGEFWISFQCRFCSSNYRFDDTDSVSKSGVISHQLGEGGLNFRRANFASSASSWGTPSNVTNSSYTPSFSISGFSTTDTIPPTISSSTPADDATGVLPSTNIVLNFSEDVAKGTGDISIVRTSDDSAQVIDVNDSSVSISGSTVTINPGTDLDLNTDYHLLIDSTAFVDLADTPNPFAGISSNTVLNFKTIAAPILASSTPIDDATRVSNIANIVLNFDRDITAQSGKNVTIVNTDDASDNRVIAADDAQVTISGSAVTINPNDDLRINSSYAVTFDAGAFADVNGIGVLAQADQTALNFTTAPLSFAGLTVALDAELADVTAFNNGFWQDVSGNNFDVELKVGLDNPVGHTGPQLVTEDGIKSVYFLRQSNEDRSGDYGVFVTRSDGEPKVDLLNNQEYTKLVWMNVRNKFERMNILTAHNATHNFWFGYDENSISSCKTSFEAPRLAAAHKKQDCYSTVQAQTDLEANQWQLGVVTFSADAESALSGQRLYINGSLVDEAASATDAPLAGYKTHLGAYGTGNTFDGRISQVYIYDRALDAAEINQIYEATAGNFGLNLKTVTFDANGGTVDIASLKSNASDGQVSLQTPSKSNADFLGWFTSPTGGTKVEEPYTPDSDVTIYAQWDSRYAVTFSSGTNATGAPASANFLQSSGSLTLPTPTRADYVFEGWFTAATGGTKIGNAGAAYTPNADLTLHGQWTQASLAGIPASDRTLVNTAVMTNGVGSTNTLTIGSSSVAVSIPGDAFATGVEVRTYSVANNNKAQAMLPNESDFVNSIVVAWTEPVTTTVPVANSPIQIVITDPNIKEGAKVYSILGDQTTLLATATQDGTVTIFFTVDPLITIANPVVDPPATQTPIGGVVAPVVPEADAESDVDDAPAVARGWTRAMADGTVKFYARDLVGAGKVRFMLNGREIAWVRAADASDPKLNVGPAAARDGLVRTVGPGSRWSLVDGRNVLEIYVGDTRLVRRIFTQ